MAMKSTRRVLVAVKPDGQADALVASGASLAKALGAQLQIISVFEPPLIAFDPIPGVLPGIGPNLIETHSTKVLTHLTGMLSGLARKHSSGLEVTTALMRGTAKHVIVEEADAPDVAAVVVGTGRSTHRFVPTGWSVVLSLMARAKAPVLTVPQDAELDLGGVHARLLVADDLREKSLAAVELGFEMAARLNKATVRHVHVEQAFLETVGPIDFPIPDDARGAVGDYVMTKLKSRGHKLKQALIRSGGQCEEFMTSGPVDRAVTVEVESFKPDLIIFGRHRGFTQVASFGQLPFYAMLAFGSPVLVVP